MSNENYGPVNPGTPYNNNLQGATTENVAPANTNKAPELIAKLAKFAPYFLIGGALLAAVLFFTGNHIVVYESSTGRCGYEGCTRTRLSLPMIAAIVAIVDGITFTIFGQLQKAQNKAKASN